MQKQCKLISLFVLTKFPRSIKFRRKFENLGNFGIAKIRGGDILRSFGSIKTKIHNIHKIHVADVQNTFYHDNEHAPGVDRWPKPTTIAVVSTFCLESPVDRFYN